MFNNIINFYDIVKLARKVRQGQAGKVLAKLVTGKSGRVRKSWSRVENPPINWWDIPEVKQRWDEKISGTKNLSHQKYFARKYFDGMNGVVGLSLGCGRGDVEMKWAATGKFARIDAFDLSENRISFARKAAQENGLSEIINFRVGDVYTIELGKEKYDFIFTEGSLHHFSQLAKIVLKIKAALKPGGYFFLNEFVGPTRFQWTERQLQIVNGILAILPPEYRIIYNSRRRKNKVHRPGRLWMQLSDPSEAVESDRILPLIEENFTIVEKKGYGGTILSLLFSEIAHNFMSDDPATKRLLQLCFDIEDALLTTNDIRDDYVMMMCEEPTK